MAFLLINLGSEEQQIFTTIMALFVLKLQDRFLKASFISTDLSPWQTN